MVGEERDNSVSIIRDKAERKEWGQQARLGLWVASLVVENERHQGH